MISPLQQAGSWSLRDWLIVVGRVAHGGWPVEITDYNHVHFSTHVSADAPCYAALKAVMNHFGETSAETREFRENYSCENGGRAKPLPRKMKIELDGASFDAYVELFEGTMWSCEEEYEYGDVEHYKSPYSAELLAMSGEDCELIEQTGVWARVNDTRKGHGIWIGPFDSKDEALDFMDRTEGIRRTSNKMQIELDGVKPSLPKWIRRR